MATTITSRKLKIQFNVTPSATSTSSKRTWTFNNITDEPTANLIQALVTAMITNGSVFDTPPISAIEAIYETTAQESFPPNA